MRAIAILLTVIIYIQNSKVYAITGGKPAEEGEFPFIVSIKESGSTNCHFCAGTIIADRWILTSNACYSRSWWGSISFGSSKISTPTNYTCDPYNSTIQRRVDDVLYNPNAYDRQPYTHDLVLVHLNESIPFSKNVQPVKLAEVDEEWPVGKTGTILGWGYGNDYLSKVQTDLQKAEVVLHSEEYCANSSLWGGWVLTDPTVMQCGGGVNTTYYCYADYGGPLLVDGKQYGIISYIHSDADSKCGEYLGIFSPVSYFREWIKDTTGI